MSSLTTHVGQFLVNEALPEDMRDYSRVIDKKGVAELMDRLATEHPDQYKDTVYKLHKVGHASAEAAGSSISLAALIPPKDVQALMDQLRGKVHAIMASEGSDEVKNEAARKIVFEALPMLEKQLYESAIKEKNPFAIQVLSGSRGGKADLRSLLVGDLLVTDHKGKIIDMPIMHGYAHGLDPAEYWAGSYGARSGTLSVKFAVAKAGFLSKQLSAAAHRQVVTELDCKTPTGIPVEASSPDNIGTVLALDAGPLKAGSTLTAANLKLLGDKTIVVRSPLTCHSHQGVCSKCVGINETGGFPKIGDAVGLVASQSLTEQLSQKMLGAKHCLHPDTLVRMGDFSVRRVGDIKAGDIVLGADKDGNTFKTKVVATYDNGLRECCKTTFRVGYKQEFVELVATPEHQFLGIRECSSQLDERLNGVSRMLQLKQVGNRVFAKPAGLYLGHDGVTDPFALAVGLVIGDGCITGKTVVGFSCADPLLLEDVKESFARLNLKIVHHAVYYHRIAMIKECPNYVNGRYVHEGFRNPLKAWFDARGMIGKYSYQKTLPEEVFSWSNASIASLLAGLFSADGSVFMAHTRGEPRVGISYSCTSQKLMEQIAELLFTRFGIHTSKLYRRTKEALNAATIKTRPNSPFKHNHDVWKLSITARELVVRFERCIPLVGIKARKLRQMLKDSMQVYQPAWRFRRHSQVPVGLLPTVDIEVESSDHLFVLANGLIVSNSGARAKGNESDRVKGYDLINQMVQGPDSFKDAAAIAHQDGIVQKIHPAPAGGTIIDVSGIEHFVPQGLNPTVQPGDRVEEGQQMSEGIPNPAELIQHAGIGDTRMRFVEEFKKAFANEGLKASRRNIELLARGLLNHVRVTDVEGPEGSFMDDVLEYNTLEHDYKPRTGSQRIAPQQAVGKYLESPVLHHTIGTKVTPGMIRGLKEAGIPDVLVHDDVPSFQPEMIRAMETLTYSPDWRVRLGGSYLQRGILEGVHRGRESSRGVSYIPALAESADFGKDLTTKGVY